MDYNDIKVSDCAQYPKDVSGIIALWCELVKLQAEMATTSLREGDRGSASVRWFRNTGNEPGSFQWIMDILGWDAETIWKQIQVNAGLK